MEITISYRMNFTCVNKTEAMHERPHANAKVERGSTFTFTHDPPFIASILFMRVKFTCMTTLNSLLMMSLGAGALKVSGEGAKCNKQRGRIHGNPGRRNHHYSGH